MASARSTVGNTATGAATGATIGSVAGPYGAAIGGVVGGLAGLGYSIFGGDDDKAKKALLAKQREMAKAYEAERERQHQAGLQGLSQQAMAFGPRNQMMAQMFGAEAAFTPQQFADMTSDPGAKSLEEANAAWTASAMQNPIDPVTRSRTRGAMNPQVVADLERARENEKRKQWVMAQMGPTPQGPAPIQMPRPQPGRR